MSVTDAPAGSDQPRPRRLARRLARKLATFRRLPLFVLAWLVPAWAMIGLSSAAIALVPFRVLAPRFGRNLGACPFVPLATPAQQARAAQIRGTIAIAARYAPFRSNCYPQAMVAQALCRLYDVPSAMHFGAAFDRSTPGEALKAHAWVVSGPVAVSGGNVSFRQFGVLGCFVTPGLEL